MLLSALAGGASPHSSARRLSVETIAFGCWSRIANSEGRPHRSPAHAASLIRPGLVTDDNGVEPARAVRIAPRAGRAGGRARRRARRGRVASRRAGGGPTPSLIYVSVV